MAYRIICTLVFLALMPVAAQAQSFNCRTPDRPDEVLICQRADLSALDERMSSLYFTLRNRLGGVEREALESSQRRWLEQRFDCGRDYQCIKDLYDRRIAFLLNY